MALLKFCSWPGCRAQIPYDQKFCRLHAEAGVLRATKLKQEAEARRTRWSGTSASRGYGSKWRDVAKKFLAKHPLCAECERQGVIAQATCVDHIVPHKGDKKLFWDRKNWQPLCHECHSRKTAREDGGFGNPSKA